MFCRQHSHRIVQFATAAFLLGGSSAFGVDGPSFDCRGVRQTLGVILCTNPEAAQADWDLSTAYWASFTDNRNEKAFSESVYQRCALPHVETEAELTARIIAQGLSGGMFGLPMPTPQPVTEQHVKCVITAFHERATVLRGKLTGDALAESNLNPDEHKDVQVALARKGFLQNRVRGYGANADGQFGPNTRAAIKEFQRSIGAQATGFLSSEHRSALVGSPREREALALQTGPTSNSPAASCQGILARPEVQKFAATALAATKQDQLRKVPMDQLSAAIAIEKFQLHMRNVLSADPRYSNANDLDRVMKAINEAGSDGLKACFPQVSELAVNMANFEKDLKQRTVRINVLHYEDMLRRPYKWTDCLQGRAYGQPVEIPAFDLEKDIAEFGKQKVYQVLILAMNWLSSCGVMSGDPDGWSDLRLAAMAMMDAALPIKVTGTDASVDCDSLVAATARNCALYVYYRIENITDNMTFTNIAVGCQSELIDPSYYRDNLGRPYSVLLANVQSEPITQSGQSLGPHETMDFNIWSGVGHLGRMSSEQVIKRGHSRWCHVLAARAEPLPDLSEKRVPLEPLPEDYLRRRPSDDKDGS